MYINCTYTADEFLKCLYQMALPLELKMAFTPLQTERLTLRLHAPSDIPALMPLIGAREVAATTLRIPHP